jgi:hypothetical protein
MLSIRFTFPLPVSLKLASQNSENLAPPHSVEPAEQLVVCKTKVEVNISIQKH